MLCFLQTLFEIYANQLVHIDIDKHVPSVKSSTAASTSTKSQSAVQSKDTPSRRSTPVLPPGLRVPFVRQQLDENASPVDRGSAAPEVTLMPELGRVRKEPESAVSVQSTASAPTSSSDSIPITTPPKVDPSLTDHQQPQQPPKDDSTREPVSVPSSRNSTRPANDDSFPALPKARPAAFASLKAPSSTANSSSSRLEKRVLSKTDKRDNLQKTTKVEPKFDMANVKPTEAAVEVKAQTPEKRPSAPNERATDAQAKDPLPAANATSEKPETLLKLENVTTSKGEDKIKGILKDAPKVTIDTTVGRPQKPRMLRVLPDAVSKYEKTPSPTVSSSASPPPAPLPKVNTSKPERRPSRQPSVASTSATEIPGGERVDEEMSTATESRSVSRASSPPPSGKIDTTTSRGKGTNQQKRERVERLKIEKSSTAPEPSPTPEDIVHEPIIGRKKKTRKPITTPTIPATRTDSPKQKQERNAQVTPVVDKPVSPAPIAATMVSEVQDQAAIASSPKPQDEANDAFKKASSVAQAIIESLQASGELSPAALNFFKTAPNFTSPKVNDTGVDPELQPPLTKDELELLDSGKPVRRAGANGETDNRNASAVNRLLVAPRSRLCMHGLSRDMEDRLLELEALIHASNPPQKYTNRPTNQSVTAATRLVDELLQDMAAALIEPAAQQQTENKALKNGQARQRSSSPSKPAAYADDALAYLNQFILPVPVARTNTTVPTKQYAANRTSYNNDADTETPAISSAIPRTYTTGDPTYSVAGVDVSPSSATTTASQSQGPLTTQATAVGASHTSYSSSSTPASTQGAGGQSWADNLPAGLKQLSPLFELGNIPTDLKFDELIGGKAARDALAASLGAASNTLASVASAAAAAAAANSPSGSKEAYAAKAEAAIAAAQKDHAGWKRVGNNDRSGFPSNAGWQEYMGELALPQDVIDLGTDAIRQAIMASGITGGTGLEDVRGMPSGVKGSKGSPESAEIVYASARTAGGKSAGSAGVRSSSGQGMRGGAPKASQQQQQRSHEAVELGEAAARALAEIEAALTAGRREVENLEKRMAGAVKRNRKVVGL